MVLDMPFNVGIGAAVQTGFQFAAEQRYDIVLRNDGDGQHAPEANPALLKRLAEGDVDVVIGSRFLGTRGDYGTPLLRRLGSGILAGLAFDHHGTARHRPDLGLRGFQSAGDSAFRSSFSA